MSIEFAYIPSSSTENAFFEWLAVVFIDFMRMYSIKDVI